MLKVIKPCQRRLLKMNFETSRQGNTEKKPFFIYFAIYCVIILKLSIKVPKLCS